MAIAEILIAWFLLSLTGALAPGPLSAAVVMQASRRGKLHGILPMVGHAIVEIGIVAGIVLSVNALVLNQFTIDLLIGFGGFVVIIFGLLAMKDYQYEEQNSVEESSTNTSTVAEATIQGAAVSILSPYFLLWWFAIGLANVTMLIAELQVGISIVFIAALLIFLTHVSTDFLFGIFLSITADKASKRAKAKGINWLNVGIGLFQILLGIWFIIQAVF
ncbi:MAG: hypothetical protein GF411_03840 [Candidatus Lokiarchaeota archaeon]|nr:hypothetical protein [Candidatus Lokiarchaeota archaeon]